MHVLGQWEGLSIMRNKTEFFSARNSALICDLSSEISDILNCIDSYGYITEQKQENTIKLLDAYIEAIRSIKEEPPSVINRKNPDKQIIFNETSALEELKVIEKGVAILARAAREKILCHDDLCFKSVFGKHLLEKGYFQEIVLSETGTEYYTLSKKGVESFKNKLVLEAIENQNDTAVIPEGTVSNVDDWGNLYVLRLELLQKYFSKLNGNPEYFTFLAPKSTELVFACEISGTLDIKYVFAGIFEEASRKSDIEQIIDILNSKMVDEIKIITKTDEEKASLISDGLNPEKITHLAFYVTK